LTAPEPSHPRDPPIAPLGDAVPRRGSWVTETLGRALLATLGWRVTGAFPNAPKMVLIGAPHTSNWDFVVGLAAAFTIRLGFSWVGKHLLFRPPVHWFLRWLGGIPVDRTASHGFVQQMVDEFDRRSQFLLAIAPEGTRKAVERWKTGFYHIAAGAGVPIVLVTFDKARRAVHVGPTVTPTGDLDADMGRILSVYADRLGRPLLPPTDRTSPS
jgi:1-acyl-sn-glycerol-3-phosphate acyltransferase